MHKLSNATLKTKTFSELVDKTHARDVSVQGMSKATPAEPGQRPGASLTGFGDVGKRGQGVAVQGRKQGLLLPIARCPVTEVMGQKCVHCVLTEPQRLVGMQPELKQLLLTLIQQTPKRKAGIAWHVLRQSP